MDFKDPVLYINSNINIYLQQANSNIINNLIKKHSEKLSETGDLSFPLKCSIWHQYAKDKYKSCEDDKTIFACKLNSTGNISDDIQRLVYHSSQWKISLKSGASIQDRCLLYFDRNQTMKILMQDALTDKNFGMLLKNGNKIVYLEEYLNEDDNSLSSYRAKLVYQVLRKLIEFSEWELISHPNNNYLHLKVHNPISKEKIVKSDKNVAYIRCGVVIDSVNDKLAKVSYDEYLSIRSKDMQLMAMHKYGIRVKDEIGFREFINQIGTAAVIVDLLEVKHSSPVTISRKGTGCTKGASFILYNSARIETLLRTFDERVQIGLYPPLPSFNDIDISLLKEEEEWQLLYNYIFPFPNLITRSLYGLENGKCSTHNIIQFLNSFAALFSVYYRRVRILTENRSHLLPTLYARIYLVKCLRKVLNLALSFINIDPIQKM